MQHIPLSSNVQCLAAVTTFTRWAWAAAAFYQYSGDDTLLREGTKMLEYLIANGTTPDNADWAWRNVPYSTPHMIPTPHLDKMVPQSGFETDFAPSTFVKMLGAKHVSNPDSENK